MEFLSPLGSGGMGEVYRARDPRLDRDVAIKVMAAHVAADPEMRRRFETEARAVAALSHPGILSIYELAIVEGAPGRGDGAARGRDAASAARARRAAVA